MNATKTSTTTRDGSAWDVYCQTARRVYKLLGVLEFKLDKHRIRARAEKDEPVYDVDLRQVARLLEQAIRTLDA